MVRRSIVTRRAAAGRAALAIAAGVLAATPAYATSPKTIVSFAAPSVGQPLQTIVAGTDGAFYGVEFGTISISGGGSAPGAPFPSIFRLVPKGAGKNGWQASQIPVAGSSALISPIGNLTAGPNSTLYGSATLNGCILLGAGFTLPCEAVVALAPSVLGQASWQASVLWHPATAGPIITGLMPATSGALIGAATDGTVFQLSPPAAGQTAWAQETLYSFGASGAFSLGRLLPDGAGGLYGTTYGDGVTVCGSNGTSPCGTVFHLAPPGAGQSAWQKTTLYAGAAGPIQLSFLASGALYGVDQAGCCGAVVKLTPGAAALPWSLTSIATFAGGADGALPTVAGLMTGLGVFYGTTSSGGLANCVTFAANPTPTGCGVIFALRPTKTGYRKTTLWSFTGGADGGEPDGGLTVGPAGELFGVTYAGGSGALGTVYRLPAPTAQ